MCVCLINCYQSNNKDSLETYCLLLEQWNYAVHHYPSILPLSSSITPSLSCYYRTHPSVPCWHLLLFPSFFISSPLEPFLIVFLSSVLFCFLSFSFSGRWVVWIKRPTWCTSRLELTVDVSLFLFLLLSFFCFFQFLSSSPPSTLALPFLLSPQPPMLFFFLCRSEKWTDELWTTVN